MSDELTDVERMARQAAAAAWPIRFSPWRYGLANGLALYAAPVLMLERWLRDRTLLLPTTTMPFPSPTRDRDVSAIVDGMNRCSALADGPVDAARLRACVDQFMTAHLALMQRAEREVRLWYRAVLGGAVVSGAAVVLPNSTAAALAFAGRPGIGLWITALSVTSMLLVARAIRAAGT